VRQINDDEMVSCETDIIRWDGNLRLW